MKEKPIHTEPLDGLILLVRGQRVILDSDLARLYGVSTGALNQAVKRNQHRFPSDFAFQLTKKEAQQIASQVTAIESDTNMLSQIVTASCTPRARSRKRSRDNIPQAFTEHGALMAANLLRSERAIEMSVFVIRAFVQIRENFLANATVLKRLAEIDATLLEHGSALSEIWQQLQPLLVPPEEPTKRQIGFKPDSA